MKHGVIRGIGKLEDERRIVFLLVVYRICIKALWWYYGGKGKLEDKKRKEIKRYIRDTIVCLLVMCWIVSSCYSWDMKIRRSKEKKRRELYRSICVICGIKKSVDSI